MRLKLVAAMVGIILFAGQFAEAQTKAEQELIDKFLKKTDKKQTKKLYWISGTYTLNRINRDNDYNKFAIYSSSHFSNAEIGWLSQGHALGLEFGWMFNKQFAWTIGGEYWLKLGQNETGSFNYSPPVGGSSTVTNLQSEIQVYGFSTNLHFYVLNPPVAGKPMSNLSVRAGAGVGYYQVSWDVWDQYENLNLASVQPATTNSTFKDNAMGFNFSLGGEYPLNFGDMALGVDLQYLYLNFDQVSWYNSLDQEVVATYEGNTASRVQLQLSGVRGKIELKKFFNW